MSDIFGMNDLSTQIMDLIGDDQRLISEVEAASPEAARQSAEIIAQEQRRILSQANFKRDKPKHKYNHVNGNAISVMNARSNGKRVSAFDVGFSADSLRLYPELIEIEFGRPGKSPRYSGITDKKGRKKGNFPAQVMPVRMGFQAAKEKAFKHYSELLLNKVSEIYRR
ncbi:MAG: hypothetical protein HDT42_06265 [Ruminococcaceae bacterium]|nr:hypothetical protein [Oscillospiraceae bacterium]